MDDSRMRTLVDQLVAVAHRAYARGLVPAVSGNLSVRVPEERRIFIKASGRSLGDVTAADMILLDFDGNTVQDTSLCPSKEWRFHLAIYQCRPEVGAVVHLHPPYAVAFAATHALPPLLTGAARAFLDGKMALVAPAPSGSRELAAFVEEAFHEPQTAAAILSEHGTVTVGADLYSAYYLSEYLEDAARTAYLAAQLRTRA